MRDILNFPNNELQNLSNHLFYFILRLWENLKAQTYSEGLPWLSYHYRREFFMAISTYQVFTTNKFSYMVPFFPIDRRSERLPTLAAFSPFNIPIHSYICDGTEGSWYKVRFMLPPAAALPVVTRDECLTCTCDTLTYGFFCVEVRR